MHRFAKVLRNISYSKNKYRMNVISSSIKCLQYPCSRSIFSNQVLFNKLYIENENGYAYNIMTNKGYANQFALDIASDKVSQAEFDRIMQDNLKNKTPQEIFQMFSKIGAYCSEHNMCISNKMFDNHIDVLTDNIKFASDDELKSLFYALKRWPETPSARSRNYIEVWAALDDECLKRHTEWSTDKILSYLSLFYMLKIIKATDYSQKVLNKLATKAKRLTPAQLVPTFFYVGALRNPPYDMHNLEIQLAQNISLLTVDDLAVTALGFFKSKTPIRSMELISKIIEKIIESSKEIHEISLAALLKLIRFSLRIIANDDPLYRLLGVLEAEVPRLSLMCCVHIALVGTPTLTVHESCLDAIARKLISSIEDARLKDIERLVLTYGLFSYKPKTDICLFEIITDELKNPRKQAQIDKYPRCYGCCVSYLGLLGIYPKDLISKVLDPKFLEKQYGRNPFEYGREILSLHNSVKIYFDNDSDMNCLTDRAAIVMAKRYTDYMPDQEHKKQYNITEKMILDTIRVLREVRGGHQYVLGDHVLTHHQRGDIIICNGKDGKPVSVEDTFPKSFGLIKRPPTDDTWVVLVIAGRNALLRKSRQATGPLQQKIVELRHIGYKANMIRWDDWSTLQTDEEKIEYLNNLITEAIQI
ncbi:hypothetical protein JYU34_009444 [Plutella xylostella]|uniref:RAP domain-containing protein n=1 Tax=Plutella xylostella TaxID=51655 RepID=A0ABQ7QMT6_PLUXY|nr:hypothetical protein JYU34_009444 [Plutella xylostella]